MSGNEADPGPESTPGAGLCNECRHARRVRSGKGSVFLRCGLSDDDERFRRYPPLPVSACDGFAAALTGAPD